LDFAGDFGEGAEMVGELDADHGKCASVSTLNDTNAPSGLHVFRPICQEFPSVTPG
jgi:hypothetical protein